MSNYTKQEVVLTNNFKSSQEKRQLMQYLSQMAKKQKRKF
jgi:hypothetical protein